MDVLQVLHLKKFTTYQFLKIYYYIRCVYMDQFTVGRSAVRLWKYGRQIKSETQQLILSSAV